MKEGKGKIKERERKEGRKRDKNGKIFQSHGKLTSLYRMRTIAKYLPDICT